jgi:hypothetical protein
MDREFIEAHVLTLIRPTMNPLPAAVNEGQGIWGVWEIRQFGGWYTDQGVFHIWPEGHRKNSGYPS